MDPKRLSPRSCVWLGKDRLTLKLANAARANAAHLAQPANQAETAKMETMAKMETRALQAKMLAKKKNCCQFRHNATAWRNQVQLDRLAPRATTEHLETTANQVAMDNLARKDHPARLDQTAVMDNPAQVARPAKLANSSQAKKAQLVQLATLAAKVKPANQAKMVVLAPKANQEMLAPLALVAKMAALAVLEMLANPALLAAANTARQLVWLQAIKRWKERSRQARENTRYEPEADHTKISIMSSFFHCSYFGFFATNSKTFRLASFVKFI